MRTIQSNIFFQSPIQSLLALLIIHIVSAYLVVCTLYPTCGKLVIVLYFFFIKRWSILIGCRVSSSGGVLDKGIIMWESAMIGHVHSPNSENWELWS